jgi:formylglycine-generating enzyme
MNLRLSLFSASPSQALAILAATLLGTLFPSASTRAQSPNTPGATAAIDWQRIEPSNAAAFEIARTETTIGQFKRFIQSTPLITLAEQRGGGEVFEGGWTRMPGWTWRTPMGGSAARVNDNEPAVHVSFAEAQAFCKWAGGALPTDQQWVQAAYTETRAQPSAGFVRGTTYPYPTGASPDGAQCLGDCGSEVSKRAIRHGASLSRGEGHASAGSTKAGVNGLYDMGANAWEWVDEPPGASTSEKRTRGGSWWYGAAQMRAEYLQSKPPFTTVVYIGFRCARVSGSR